MIARLLVPIRKPQKLSKPYLHNIQHVIIVKSIYIGSTLQLPSESNYLLSMALQRKSTVLKSNENLFAR